MFLLLWTTVYELKILKLTRLYKKWVTSRKMKPTFCTKLKMKNDNIHLRTNAIFSDFTQGYSWSAKAEGLTIYILTYPSTAVSVQVCVSVTFA